MPTGTPPICSIIVCTHNRAAILVETIESILDDPSATPRELIIVDNASSDGTSELLQSLQDRGVMPVIPISEPRLGKSHALNTGIRAARGGILLFTDDDVRVEPGWVDELVAAFNDASVAVAAGPVRPLWLAPPPEWLVQSPVLYIVPPDGGPDDRPLREDEIVYGANMALRASILPDGDGPYDPQLGPQGKRRLQGEETHLVRELLAQHRGAYRARAVVHHRVPPEHVALPWLRSSAFDLGVGAGRAERLRGEPLASLSRRLVRMTRLFLRAHRLRRSNDRKTHRDGRTSDELRTYRALGHSVELATPRLSHWVGALVRKRGR